MNLIFERFFSKFTRVRPQTIPQLSSENGKQIKLILSLENSSVSKRVSSVSKYWTLFSAALEQGWNK